MTNIPAEYQKWVKCLQDSDLESVIKSLQSFKFNKNNEESNKYLFKLLLHLAHSADKCKKQQLSKEIEIFQITSIICENLSKVPDKVKFYSALYFIIQPILNKWHFKEAKTVSSLLFPGKILDENDSYKSVEYYQVAKLWQAEIFNKLDSIIASGNSKKESLSDEIRSNIKFLLHILNYCDEDNCQTFRVAELCIKKLSSFPISTAFPCLLEIFQNLANYFVQLKKYPLVNAYQYIILMIGHAFFKRSDSINNANVLGYFRQCDSLFGETIKSSSESYNCYKFFREYAINLFETNYMSKEINGPRIKKCFDTFEAVLERYGKENRSLTETLMALAYSFETLFGNWEGPVAKQLENVKITYDHVVYVGEFVKKVYSVIRNRQLPPNQKCTKCSDPTSCKVKKDMYNATVAVSTFLRVVNRCAPASITEKMFFLTKELLEDMVSVFNEIHKAGCENARTTWNLCGKMIFNFGLITEAKYPAELEKLYEVLCMQIVRFDGLDCKISGIGMENPVSTALTRLCNSNFNRELYRKAMSYTAYNALLSMNESRQKKACDMWGIIKQKGIDSMEIQELTMIKCLEIDADVVKKLGINVDIRQYDLADLCLKELKSLFPVPINVMVSMKRTLKKLESIGNSLQYGQGVLLLCFHVLQFEKREIISDYITKAIEKLKNSKAKSISSYCVLANLNFFRVLEKLYVRKQAIAEQIEDANWTVKAFKTLKGRKDDEEPENKKEVLPTYGGINIEEDNRCANELREVLTMWENCFLKDFDQLVSDWEPKFTLETITICGEYCRLYKFNSIEEKSWKLAYKLAAALEDFPTCLYVTGRSISLRYINETWISEAHKHADKLKDSTKIAETNAVALFWLSLADFYLDCKQVNEAIPLLDKAKALPNFDLLVNTKMYIYYVDIQFRNFFSLNQKASQEEYTNQLVQIHYLLINLHDWVSQDSCRFWSIRNLLFGCEQMFEVMCNIVVPMVGLLSFREIISHMTGGLILAQKFGMTLRIAQYLKYFCYIDLLRLQAESCETRLQDLEHILCLENFQKSMNAKKVDVVQSLNSQFSKIKITNAVTVREAIHDPISLSRNNASPELKKKLFTMPEFMRHSHLCQCFTCTSLYYQYLTFSCTYIRAQLYSLLKYTNEAEQHYYGAFKIKSVINDRDPDSLREHKKYKWCRSQTVTVDYISYLLDFAVHIIDFVPEQKNDALALIEEALDVASQNGLDKHCIAVFATELYYQHFIYNLPQDKLFSAIYVPADIPITITNQPASGCITPLSKQQVEKTARNPRRRKTPPPMPIVNIVDITDSSDEENNCGNSPVPKAKAPKADVAAQAVAPKTRQRVRNVRRKILTDEVEEKEEPQKLTRSRTSLKSKEKEKEKEEEAKLTRTRSVRLKSSTSRL